MPIINPQDASEVGEYIDRFFEATGTGRAQALRRLFVEKLDFASATGVVSLANVPKNVTLPPQAERIASIEGLHVVYVPLDPPGPARVRKAEAAAAAKTITDTLHGDLLLVMTNPSGSQLHVIYPSIVGAMFSLRRMIIERDLPRRTAVQQLSEIFHEWQRTSSIGLAVDKAFDVEAVTKQFFEEYKRVFDNVMNAVKGFGQSEEEEETKKLFVQTLFNRLMFVYFLSRKGWLKFNGETDYLQALRKDYPAQTEDKNFYTDRLKALFFAGLNNDASRDVRSPILASVIGDVPFLNGGLFDATDIDNRPNILVPDSAIDQILRELFERFNFTVMESTPFDVEVAVDPEMLGKVFEELVTGRHESGSYYTPRPVVSFMCREALKGYLETQDTGASIDAIKEFIDQKDTGKLDLSTAPKIGAALARVKVVDPACGSGAYLLGMMQELVELMTSLYSAQLSHEAKDLYNLKLQIIENNLYGADIDQFAVNIAMLRLWLSLAIEYDGPVPPPLPNLNFKIVCGDSLLGPDPSPENYGTLFRHRTHELAGQLTQLKQKHMRETGSAKLRMAVEIEAIQESLREVLADSVVPEGVVDWRVDFAEVFDRNGGFDILVENPPYVNMFQMDSADSEYRGRLRESYATARGGFDLYVPFLERAFELLQPLGTAIHITPNKLLSAEYANKFRELAFSKAQLSMIVDLSHVQVFEASVYPVITMFRKTIAGLSSDANVSVYIGDPEPEALPGVNFLYEYPTELAEHAGNLWSVFLSDRTHELLPALQSALRLKDVAEVTASAAVSEAYEWVAAVADNGEDLVTKNGERFVPFVVSGNIRPYYTTWDSSPVRYLKTSYHQPALDLMHPAISEHRRNQITSSKVIVSGMGKRPVCIWDSQGIASGIPTLLVIPRPGSNGAFLAALLNSDIMSDIYRTLFGSLSLAGGYMRFGSPQLRVLPVPEAPAARQEKIAGYVADMNNAGAEDKKSLMQVINSEIADLFGVERN